MDLLIRGVPAVVLLVTGVISIVGAMMLPTLVRATNGPHPGEVSMEELTFVAAGVVFGLVLVWLGRGVWSSKLWRTRAAMFFSVAVLAVFVQGLASALTLTGIGYNRNGPAFPPDYGRAQQDLFLIVLYGIALACLFVLEGRRAAKIGA
jgi:hypothetical protein